MKAKLRQLRRLIESSFPKIDNFHEKFNVEFEKLENAKSFWSEIYVAHLKKSSDGEEESEHTVPENVFVKIPRIGDNVRRCEDSSEEDRLYEILLYYSKKENLFYHHFAHNSIPNFPFPKVYFTEDIDGEATGGIVAENLADFVYSEEHIPGLNEQQIFRLLEALAGLHSHLIKRENKDYVESFKEGAHGRETLDQNMQKLMLDEALTLQKISPAHFGNERIERIAWAFDYNAKNKAMEECIAAIPGIICHADLNVTNILFKKNSKTSEIGAIIDFQMVFIGSVAHDIIRILTLGLRKEERRKNTQRYLEYYFKHFEAFFEKGKVPFGMQELLHQYRTIYPFTSNFTLFGIVIYIKMYQDGTLGLEENKEKNVEELIDRAVGIVEDIEHY